MPTTPDCAAFQYSPQPHNRRHGPSGYADVESFRPWLRDEFTFRCAYCLIREQWGRTTGEFDLDHFVPQQLEPDLALDYDNLVYACRTCNVRKGAQAVPDPSASLTGFSVRVYPDGTLVATSAEATRLIRLLCLNSPAWTRWRRMWIRIVELAESHDADLYRMLMGFPEDLPNLSRRRPPANERPDGVGSSFAARRERGELPDEFLW